MADVLAQSFETVAAGDVECHPDNPRRGDLDAIRESIAAHGFYGVLVVQASTRRILVGNHRYRAGLDAGIETFPAMVVDVDDDTARRILLVDNRANELAGWDERQLADVLEQIALAPRGLEGTGYDTAALGRLLRRWRTVGDPEAIPDPPPPTTKPGDLWLCGRHRLLCGDSTNAEHVARVMAGERARLMATDPPYLVNYDGTNRPPSSTNVKAGMVGVRRWDDYTDETEDLYPRFLAAACDHALADDAVIYQWHSHTKALWIAQCWAEAGILAHQPLLYWIKARAVLGRSHFMWQTEPCVYGWRRGHQPGRDRRPPSTQPNVWFADQAGATGEHPTEKPLVLFTDPYTWHLHEGEVGYEPFSGSGTALVAAEVTGRRCCAIEREARYVDVACRRYQRTTGERPVLEATGEAHDFDVDTDASEEVPA